MNYILLRRPDFGLFIFSFCLELFFFLSTWVPFGLIDFFGALSSITSMVKSFLFGSSFSFRYLFARLVILENGLSFCLDLERDLNNNVSKIYLCLLLLDNELFDLDLLLETPGTCKKFELLFCWPPSTSFLHLSTSRS